MDDKLRQIIDEVVKLSEQIARETRETESYARKGDYTTALRNANDHRDEVQALVREYQQLTNELQRLTRR